MEEQARMKILDMIDSGKISAEEGLRLLQSLQEQDTTENNSPAVDLGQFFQIDLRKTTELQPDEQIEEHISATVETSESHEPPLEATDAASASEQEPTNQHAYSANNQQTQQKTSTSTSSIPLPADVEKWRRWWTIPLWVGVGITVVCGVLMYQAFVNQGFSFWFVCLWVPFFLGVALMALSYGSRNSRWLHLRVDQKPGERPQHIAISMPLPIRFVTWLYHNFGHYVPDLQDKPIEEILNAVKDGTSRENPMYIEVNDDDGERVKVYIG